MKIGVIADTHNQIVLIKKALELFKKEKVEMIIHAGDMDLANTLEEFDGIEIPIKMALGNIDQEPEFFIERAHGLGLDFVLNAFLDFDVGDKPFDLAPLHEGRGSREQGLRRFYVFHGNVRGKLSDVIDILIASKKYDVIIHGHTHRPMTEIRNDVLILNPGSLQPLSVGIRPSVAIYDVGTGRAEIVEL